MIKDLIFIFKSKNNDPDDDVIYTNFSTYPALTLVTEYDSNFDGNLIIFGLSTNFRSYKLFNDESDDFGIVGQFFDNQNDLSFINKKDLNYLSNINNIDIQNNSIITRNKLIDNYMFVLHNDKTIFRSHNIVGSVIQLLDI